MYSVRNSVTPNVIITTINNTLVSCFKEMYDISNISHNKNEMKSMNLIAKLCLYFLMLISYNPIILNINIIGHTYMIAF